MPPPAHPRVPAPGGSDGARSRWRQLIRTSAGRRYSGATSPALSCSWRCARGWASSTSTEAEGWAWSGDATTTPVPAAQQLAVTPRPVAHRDDVLAHRNQLRRQIGRGADGVLGDPKQRPAVGHRAIQRPEHLAPAGVDHAGHEGPAPSVWIGQEVQASQADHGDVQRRRQRLCRGDAYPQAGEQPRADVDRDGTQPVEADPRLEAQVFDGRRQGLGVASTPGQVKRRHRSFVVAEGAADLGRRRLQAQNDHEATASRSACTRAGVAHRGPTGRRLSTRSSLPAPKSNRMSR